MTTGTKLGPFVRVVSADWQNTTDIEGADGMLVNNNGGLSVFRGADLVAKFADSHWSACHAMERTEGGVRHVSSKTRNANSIPGEPRQ